MSKLVRLCQSCSNGAWIRTPLVYHWVLGSVDGLYHCRGAHTVCNFYDRPLTATCRTSCYRSHLQALPCLKRLKPISACVTKTCHFAAVGLTLVEPRLFLRCGGGPCYDQYRAAVSLRRCTLCWVTWAVCVWCGTGGRCVNLDYPDATIWTIQMRQSGLLRDATIWTITGFTVW